MALFRCSSKKVSKKTGLSFDDMRDTLSNIMQLCCFMLSIVTGLIGTVPRDELVEGNFRTALASQSRYRQFVAWHLSQRVPPFNFTKELGDGTTFDVKELLNDQRANHNWQVSGDDFYRRVNWGFYMTKDDVEPWVVALAEQILLPEGWQTSSFMMECYMVSTTISITCLLTSFFLYMALGLGSFRSKEKSLEVANEAARDKSPEVAPKKQEKMVDQEEGDRLKEQLQKELQMVEWLTYTVSIVLLLAMSVSIGFGFAAIVNLGQIRSPSLRHWDIEATKCWASAIALLVVASLSSLWLHVHVARIKPFPSALTAAGGCPSTEQSASGRRPGADPTRYAARTAPS